MRLTKAQKIWRESYEEARSVRPVAESLDAACRRLQSRTGVELSFTVIDDSVRARAVQPGGLIKESNAYSPDTLTHRLRAAEEVLAVTYRKNTWR